ncbi:linalool dehydratase/isomerase domain-containing protein [Uliginosibacterium aquaticum]|uniref:Linalool dehydratase/isomerase domain-containing protein n=1 Tax=Uliginosibacterium aquaticum TaxID=2731212 RepID=A0ABX2IP56_9RHOO|nr:hypothetical protein [Uliginosibacterium aquaticum]NSL55890.1 hypothetical protein [Uliginosibacterium aquaticum]
MSPCLLPDRRLPCGPLSLSRLLRLGAIYGLLCLSGAALAGGAGERFWQVFGLGLILPGGGFFARADCASAVGLLQAGLFVASLLIFAAACLLWFATGNLLAPPVAWLLAALTAAWMQPGGASADSLRELCLLVLCGLLSALLLSVLHAWRGRRQRVQANHDLVHEAAALACRFERPAEVLPAELSPQELKLMGFVLDRALQPMAEFEGFEWRDQFQTAAVRYQLHFMGYALAMARSTRLPAFSGYLDEAQQNLIHKQADHRVWRYWALENLWGNLRRDPDPIARENIMYTGFLATQMALYQASSGRREFARPGSLPLRHPDSRLYQADLPALTAALQRGFGDSPFTLMACEPNWIYPLCNAIGVAGIRACDAQRGERHWAGLAARFRASLETEFITLGGAFVPCRSSHTGLALPGIGGAMPQALPSFFLNASLPDIALRQWLLLRRSLLDARGALRLTRFWSIDTGNYGHSPAAALAATALAAVEMGDREVAGLCFEALEQTCPARDESAQGGPFWRPRASVWAHAVELMARTGEAGAFRRLVTQPSLPARQPHISRAAYPEVRVARAVQHGGVLMATLYPGLRPGLQTLDLAGLRPGQIHLCSGCVETRVRADAQGAARVTVSLDARREILIQPYT